MTKVFAAIALALALAACSPAADYAPRLSDEDRAEEILRLVMLFAVIQALQERQGGLPEMARPGEPREQAI